MTDQKKVAEAGARKAYFNRYIVAGIHTVRGFESEPDSDKPQVIFGWELTEDFTDEDTPRPMWVKPFGNGNINNFDGEKSKKTKWMTDMFMDYDVDQSDPSDYLGQGCRVVMKHNPGKGKHEGRTFANLTGVRDYDGDLPPISQPAVYFDFYNPDADSLEKLFPWEVEFLQLATDYPGSKLETLISGTPVVAAETKAVEVAAPVSESPDY